MTSEITTIDEQQQVMMQAAAAYHHAKSKIQELEEKVSELVVVLEGRNARIEGLERAAQEDMDRNALYAETMYNRMKVLEAQRDEALLERDQMRVVFASFKAQLDCIELPLQDPPRRERKPKPKPKPCVNGDGNLDHADELPL